MIMHNWMLKTALAVLLSTLGSLTYAEDFSELLSLEPLRDAKIITQEQHSNLEKFIHKAQYGASVVKHATAVKYWCAVQWRD